MRGGSNGQTQYLSLALMSRKAINGLRKVSVGDPPDLELEESLKKLLAGMDWHQEANFVNHLEASGAWTSFEELTTIAELRNEVGAEFETDLVSFLQEVGETRSTAANRLMGFLAAVEGRALQHYADASQPQML
jgi:hypothetical protein